MSDLFAVGTRLGGPNGTDMEIYDKATGRTVAFHSAVGTGLPQQIYGVVFTATLAQINAGLTVVAADANRKIIPVDFHLVVVGAFTTATDVRLSDTAASPVDIVTVAVAGLYSGAIITPASAVLVSSPPELGDVTIGAGFAAALTAGKGVQIRTTGSTLAGGTSIAGILQYVLG